MIPILAMAVLLSGGTQKALADLEPTTSEQTLQLRVSVSAPISQALDSVHIWDNNVPVFGRKGYTIPFKPGQGRSKWTGDLPKFLLESGDNKIEIAVRATNGVFSLRTPPKHLAYLPPGGKITRSLRVLAVGVSPPKTSYLDPLPLAKTDARSFYDAITAPDRELFATTTMEGLMPLQDGQATRSHILGMKRYLMQTTPDDTVVLYFEGHGFNSNGMFYFGTYNIDPNRLTGTALSYSDILDLLEGIPARHRLVLIDACNSGPRAPGDTSSADAPPESFDLMLDIFADLDRGEGAEVIGSASGYQEAIQATTDGHGKFAAAVLEAIKNPTMISKTGLLTVTQLRDYVQKRVASLTNRAQKPSERQTNLEGADWRIR